MLTQSDIAPLVALALEEDIGSGDITAGLVSADEKAIATVITREPGVLCGTQFVDAIFDACVRLSAHASSQLDYAHLLHRI